MQDPVTLRRNLRAVPDPSISDSLERVSSSGQRLVAHQLELFTVEMKRAALQVAWILLGGAFALLGWIFMMRGLIMLLSRFQPQFFVELSMGALHVMLGTGVFLYMDANRKPDDRKRGGQTW